MILFPRIFFNYKIMYQTKSKLNLQAFTLVELIVVIVILAILATIAFLSFSSQSGSARDSTRLSDISSIKKWMEMYNVNSWLYPTPDKPTSFTYSGWTIWNQWTLWDSAYKLIQKTLSKKVKDPLKDSEYDYSLAANKREYQVAWNFENPTSFEKTYNPFESDFLISHLSILNSPDANALGWTWTNVYISWNYNWVLLKVFTGSTYYFVPTPTLFWINPTSQQTIIYDNAFWSGKDLLPWINNVAIFDSSKVYSTTWAKLTDDDITNLMITVKAAYSTWNVTTPAVQAIVNASWAELINIWNWLIKNSLWGWTSVGWNNSWDWELDGYTSLLLHWDNVSAITNFIDSSSSAKTITANGNAIQKSWIGYFNWAGWNHISIPDSPDFDFSGSNWTIDLWLYPTNLSAYPWFISQLNNTDNNWCAYIHTNGAIAVWVSWVNEIVSAAWKIVNNKWQHVAIVKNWTTTTIYVDWKNVASWTASVWTNSTYPLLIGGFLSAWANQYFGWYIDEVRISNIARWSANFDTNLPIWPYVNDENTKLLLHFDWIWANYTDSSSFNKPITPYWTVSQTWPKIGNWSIYLDWSSSFLNVPASNDFAFWTGNFTIDAWVRPDLTRNHNSIFWNSSWTSPNTCMSYIRSTWTIELYCYNSSWVTPIVTTSAWVVTNWVWTHIAYARNWNNITIYVDGISRWSWTYMTAFWTNSFNVWFDWSSTYYWWFIDEFRVSKWIDRSNWTSFPVPTNAY
ncbi:MAG: Structural protein [uncultured bacterium (gcode 4)]|uniref:Structural protein n=1 Tax=uncultured bacterium (gcode 4) TaxID=1234023 RepID=K2GGD6_9BACT|nr:MAG: Structural protein [uncultured bacterium (gcode 4)]